MCQQLLKFDTSVPSTMLAPILTIENTDVKISWLTPDNGGSAIIAYHIYFMDYSLASPAYTEYTAICDGSNSTIMTQKYCLVPMSTFISTLNYTAGQLLLVTVKAQNSVGLSDANVITQGIVAESTPQPLPSLTASALTDTSIQVNWNSVTLVPSP